MNKKAGYLAAISLACTLTAPAMAALTPAGIWNGNVGLSVDAVGGNNAAVGDVLATIPVTATVLQAYLYSAGTPFPFYPDSPNSLADYNSSGITLAGQAVDNFDTLVGATSTRVDIGQWYTGRADVTALVQSLLGAGPNYSWAVEEGTFNTRIDGELLAIVYEDASLPEGSVAFLDGGQDTGGETSIINFANPIDTTIPGFAAELGLGISFSCCGQASSVSINGSLLSENAGNFDDGNEFADGSLITVGGLGDPFTNGASYSDDRERYDLAPFLSDGDTGFTLFTENPTDDDNIFFASLYVTGEISNIRPGVPAPASLFLFGTGVGLLGFMRRRTNHS